MIPIPKYSYRVITEWMLLNLNRSLILFAIDDAMDFLKPIRRLCVLLLNMAMDNYAMMINTVSMISTSQRLS